MATNQLLEQKAKEFESETEGSAREVFSSFLKLGLTSFGGPIAHLAYFRREFVEERKWVSESQFAQLLALCQFLPGPASSQLGFAIGLLRAGFPGALAAFTAFTLPSASLLFAFSTSFSLVSGVIGTAAIHGLKLVALVVVAHGVFGMSRRLCPDLPRAFIAILTATAILIYGEAWVQLLVVVLGGVAGLLFCRDVKSIYANSLSFRHSKKVGGILIFLFISLLFILPLMANSFGGLTLIADGFYRAGALVFGGGHVVLPLLEDFMVQPGRLSSDEFLAGYGAAQAVPGPMFSLSAYLGARVPGAEGGLQGATVALIFIFLPGFLLLSGALPFWRALASRPAAAYILAGVNAAVVGLLGAALYDPIWISSVHSIQDLVIALVGLALFAFWRASALTIVGWCVVGSIVAAIFL